jgi:hypothetical protein
LFACFTDDAAGLQLPQILYSSITPSRRPKTIRVATDLNGRVFLGGLGILETDLPGSEIEFGRDDDGMIYCAFKDKSPVKVSFQTPLMVPNTRMQVTTDLSPAFQRFFDLPGVPFTQPNAIRVGRDRLSYLLVALGLIQAHCRTEWSEIAAFTRLIVLYRAAEPNSFAAKSAHGAIFCNVADNNDEIALLEDVAHQAAHVIFNAFAHEPMQVIAIDPETPLHQLGNDPHDVRSLNSAFHALFTYVMISRVLSKIHDARVLSERQSHEVIGRLGYVLLKFAMDLHRLDLPHAFTLAGRRCYDAFRRDYQSLRARYGALVDCFAYDNQPYTFDYGRFVERNGGPWRFANVLAS